MIDRAPAARSRRRFRRARRRAVRRLEKSFWVVVALIAAVGVLQACADMLSMMFQPSEEVVGGG